MKRLVFLASPQVWDRGHGPEHPLKPQRLQRAYQLLEAYSALEWDNVSIVAPRPASEDELALFHTPDYLRAVRAMSDGDPSVSPRRFNFGPGDNPVFLGMYESEGLKVGSALQAAELLVQDATDVAFSFSGGLHHGGPDFASGFCVFNDAVVAIHWILQQGLRVAYVDIDVHHGDGVQDAFYTEDRVLTISLHQDGRTLFPGTGFLEETGLDRGAGYCANLPLPPLTDDDAYLWAFEQIVPALMERFKPDILVSQLGVDTHYLDPLANLALTTHGHEALFKALAAIDLPWLALGGGGYNLDVVPRSWALAFAVMAGHDLPDKLPEGYRSRYGGRRLHDEAQPPIDPPTKRRMRSTVESVVAAASRLHRIAGN